MSLWKTLAVFCILLAVGVEYSHARPVYTRLDATVGSKVAIPCKVRTDRLSGASSVKLEWGMTPEGGGLYTPLLYDDVKNLQKVYVDCGIIIDSIRYRDSGIYEGRFIVDNVPYEPFKGVSIHVTDPTSTETADSKTVRKNQRNLETQWETPSDASSETADTETVWEDQSNQETQWETPSDASSETADTETVREDQSNVEIQTETPSVTSTETADTEMVSEDQSNVEIQRETPPVTSTEEVPMMSPTMTVTTTTMETSTYNTGTLVIDPSVKFIVKTYYQLKRNGYLPLACILAGLVLLVVIVIISLGLYFTVWYCKERPKEINSLKLAEEGRLEMNGGSPQIKGGSMREGDAKEDGVIVEIEDGCTAKDETRTMMEQSGEMQTQVQELAVREEQLAAREEILAKMQENFAETQGELSVREQLAKTYGELSETKNELAVKEKEITETKERLSGLKQNYLETLIKIKEEVTAMEEELTVTKEQLSAAKNESAAREQELAVTKENLQRCKRNLHRQKERTASEERTHSEQGELAK